jgi:hypothetical protein
LEVIVDKLVPKCGFKAKSIGITVLRRETVTSRKKLIIFMKTNDTFVVVPTGKIDAYEPVGRFSVKRLNPKAARTFKRGSLSITE